MSTTVYVIPSVTDASKAIVDAAREALTDPTVRVEQALGLDSLPADDGASVVEQATKALADAKANAQTFARLRFDGVALAYSTGRVGKGLMYSGQRDLAKALGMTQGRVSQILTAQKQAEERKQTKATIRDAAKQGGISDVDAVKALAHDVAVNGNADDVAEVVAALTAGRIPSGPARTLDVDALVRLAERVLTMSSEVVDVTADRDRVEQAIAMLTTARGNLSKAIATKQAHV